METLTIEPVEMPEFGFKLIMRHLENLNADVVRFIDTFPPDADSFPDDMLGEIEQIVMLLNRNAQELQDTVQGIIIDRNGFEF